MLRFISSKRSELCSSARRSKSACSSGVGSGTKLGRRDCHLEARAGLMFGVVSIIKSNIFAINANLSMWSAMTSLAAVKSLRREDSSSILAACSALALGTSLTDPIPIIRPFSSGQPSINK